MQMNPSTRAEVLSETDRGKDQRGYPLVDSVPQELCSNERTPPRNLSGRFVPDERALETFADGAGI
jgi:hypothetical protein